MILLVALLGGVSVFLAGATLTGHADSLRIRLPGKRRTRLSRQVWLRQAGVNVTPFQFWAASATTAFIAEVVCWGIGGAFAVGVVPALSAALGPRAYFARRRTEQLRAVVEAWPQAIRDLLSSIGAGRTVHQAVLELAESGPLPTRLAFADYAALARLGETPAALATIRHQLADPVSDRVIELLMVAHDQGQALTLQILHEQAAEVTRDLRTAAEIHAEAAEPRMVASAAFAMPWVALVLICAGVPAYRQFYGTFGGAKAIVFFGSMSVAGLLVALRNSKEPAEQRVLGAE